MRRARPMLAGTAVIILTLALGGPAEAGYGAIAYDQNSGKQGASFDQPDPARANEAALKQCASPDCRVHPAIRTRALFERCFIGAGRVGLIEARTLLAAILVIGDGAVSRFGWPAQRKRQDDHSSSREHRPSASHGASFRVS